MTKIKVDVAIAFYGKPNQTIVTIRSLLTHSSVHINKFILTQERNQPHGDYIGIYKVLDYFKDWPEVNLEVFKPKHFVSVGVADYERAKVDTDWRQSIMFQYGFETTNAKYLCLTHNDMLYHADAIGAMITIIENGSEQTIGVGSIGQCWSCPAGPNWGNVCDSTKINEFIPTKEEAIQLAMAHETPRKMLQLKVIEEGRVHPLPECRLNEYCCLVDIQKYRKETLPTGDLGCFGGGWNGVDLATVWSHEVYQRGYRFERISLDDFAVHAPFDVTGSGTQSYTNSERYFSSEQNAEEFIHKTWGEHSYSKSVYFNAKVDAVKRKIRRGIGTLYSFIKNNSIYIL